MLRTFRYHGGKRELPTDNGARIEVVLASPLGQFVERNATFGVARKNK